MAITRIRRSRGQAQQSEPANPFTTMNKPTMSFDDSNRENYIMRSGMFGQPTIADRKAKDVAPLQIFPPNPNPTIIVDYDEGKGGRDSSMLPDFTAPIEPVLDVTPGPVDMMPSPVDPLPEDSLGDRLRDLLDMDPTDVPQGDVFMAGLLGPGRGLGDPTGEGGIIQKLGELFGLTPRIDPENEGFPLPDDFMPVAPPGEANSDAFTLEADADTYTLPNLLQMLNDARDAGNVDEIELLTNDLEMLYPGATMDVAELTDAQKDFMLSPLQNPAFQSTGDLFNKVKQMEDKGFFGFGAQEPTTMEEMLEFMNTDAYRRAFS